MLPFVLQTPSRVKNAIVAASSMKARDEEARRFFEFRDIVPKGSEITLPSDTNSPEKSYYDTPQQTTVTVFPEPDTTPDSQEDVTVDWVVDDHTPQD